MRSALSSTAALPRSHRVTKTLATPATSRRSAGATKCTPAAATAMERAMSNLLLFPDLPQQLSEEPAAQPPAAEVTDAEARRQALDVAQSCLVLAPAGSGKTGLLIQRYLALLATVDEPEQVVTVTFTRKAAAEMRHRILHALANARAVAPDSAHLSAHDQKTHELARAVVGRDAARDWQLAESPSRLRIQTIDALCSSLAGEAALQASAVLAGAEVIEDARELYREAARRAVLLLGSSEAREENAVRCLLIHIENDVATLETLIAGMLAERDQWLRHLGSRGDSNALRHELMR